MKNGSQKKQYLKITAEDAGIYGLIAAVGLLASAAISQGADAQRFIGVSLVAALLLSVLYRDIQRYQPQYLKKPRMIALLAIMIAGVLVIGRLMQYALNGLSRGLELSAPEAAIYGIPMAAGAMLIALLFDFHTAIGFSFLISLLSGIWISDASYAVYVYVGSLTAAFSMMRCRKRTDILKGGLYVLAANIITMMAILLAKGSLMTPMAQASIVFAVIGAFFVVAIVSLALPVLEYLFKVTTDVSLLELMDLEHPLMKNLMLSAPGTYHHSLIVGNLVDACADSVGVKPLLARVGAYYHDIGKTKMPEYFIENQTTGVNKHDGLNPHMSSMILISHLKEGVELANQYKLPEELINIIQQHHGNALITYFYEKAKGRPNGADMSEQEFRYPGPKPQTRIAALIMMADAVEASSRVLTDPTPARISALVDKIINHIFITGQLEECELTLKDIHLIKTLFTRTLTGILHKRINYPGFDFDKSGTHGAGGAGIENPYKQSPREDKVKHAAHRA